MFSLDWPRSAIGPRNMAPRLIRICSIRWWCSLFSVLDRKYPIGANLVYKIRIVS